MQINNNYPSRPSSLMLYTVPSTIEHKRYYAKFAGVLNAHSVARRFVQYLIWWPLSSVALSILIQQSIAKYFELPFLLLLGLSLAVVFFLHRLMSAGYKAHLYNKWDEDPDTNSSLWLYVGIGILLAFLEWKTTSNFFQSNIEEPVTISTAKSDSTKLASIDRIRMDYQLEKAQIEENAMMRERMAAPSTYAEIDRLEVATPKNTKDRTYINNEMAKLNKQLASYPTIRKIRKETSIRLDDILVKQQQAILNTEAEHRNQVAEIRDHNMIQQADYDTKMKSANMYAGTVSIVSLFVFLICGWWEIRIRTKSGIFPKRQYTDLKAHGDVLEKGTMAIGDVLQRWFHQIFYSIHKSGSETAGQLRGFDGQVLMQDGNYQERISPHLNGRRHPVEPVGK